MLPLAVRFLGRVPYAAGLRLQEEVRTAVAAGRSPETLLLLEHDPVITLGRAARREHVLADPETLERRGIPLFRVRRGGDVTYHGPGQLVGYPVVDLRRHGRDLVDYLRRLEETLIRLLGTYGLRGERVPGRTGVWVGGAKVAAIGVHVRRWVTAHGFALNVDPDLDHFALIVPCGLRDARVTSLRRLLGHAPPLPEVADRAAAAFAAVYGYLPRAMPSEAAP